MESVAPAANVATLVIPSRWYPMGRLSVSFGQGIGIDNFSIEAICTSTLESLDLYGPGFTPTPTMIPTITPSAMPSGYPSATPSASPSADCVPDIKYSQSGSLMFDYPPIEIVSHDGNTVVFGVSQTWSDNPICLVSTNYFSSELAQETCDTKLSVGPGEFAYYKAQCENGYASVTLFVQDEIIPQGEVVPFIPEMCLPLVGGSHTVSYRAQIPCVVEAYGCPPPMPLVCDDIGDMAVVPVVDFEHGEAFSWVYGGEGTMPGYTSYLVSRGTETAKAFDVPVDSSGVVLKFFFYEEVDLPRMIINIQVRTGNLTWLGLAFGWLVLVGEDCNSHTQFSYSHSHSHSHLIPF